MTLILIVLFCFFNWAFAYLAFKKNAFRFGIGINLSVKTQEYLQVKRERERHVATFIESAAICHFPRIERKRMICQITGGADPASAFPDGQRGCSHVHAARAQWPWPVLLSGQGG